MFFSKNILRLAEVVVIISIMISSYVLFAYERKNHDPDYNKNWTAFYFVNPDDPSKGVAVENHSGKTTEFKFCLVPDSDDLMEPNDLSCNLSSVMQTVTKNIPAGNSETWIYALPSKQGKYWVSVEYSDGDLLKNKDLSFELR